MSARSSPQAREVRRSPHGQAAQPVMKRGPMVCFPLAHQSAVRSIILRVCGETIPKWCRIILEELAGCAARGRKQRSRQRPIGPSHRRPAPSRARCGDCGTIGTSSALLGATASGLPARKRIGSERTARARQRPWPSVAAPRLALAAAAVVGNRAPVARGNALLAGRSAGFPARAKPVKLRG